MKSPFTGEKFQDSNGEWHTILAETEHTLFTTADRYDCIVAKWYVDLVLGEEGTSNEAEIVFEQDALDEIEAYTVGLAVIGEIIAEPGDQGITKYMARFIGPYVELARLMTRHRDGGTLLEDNEYGSGRTDENRVMVGDTGRWSSVI